jgi:hypothetical protein
MKKIIVAFVIVCWLHAAQAKEWFETNVTKTMAFQIETRNRYCYLRKVRIGVDGVSVYKKKFDS